MMIYSVYRCVYTGKIFYVPQDGVIRRIAGHRLPYSIRVYPKEKLPC